jgi:hypothetical protein
MTVINVRLTEANSQIATLETEKTLMQNCSQALDKIKNSFANGYGDYEEHAGTCSRSDGSSSSFTTLLESGSV